MEFEDFLRQVAPLLGLQWRLFRRGGIKRKIERRITEVELSDVGDYLSRVKADPEEQAVLSQILRVTISRFFRDRKVFDALATFVFPKILRKQDHLRIWSIGCASGEEPYSLSILLKETAGRLWPRIDPYLLATDISGSLLARAREGKYKKSSLKEVPEKILQDYFRADQGSYRLDPVIRESVEFDRHDILHDKPFLGMDVVFCRNLAFTYFSKESQMGILKKIAGSLQEEGYLVLGKEETLPLMYPTLFVPVFPAEKIYQKFLQK